MSLFGFNGKPPRNITGRVLLLLLLTTHLAPIISSFKGAHTHTHLGRDGLGINMLFKDMLLPLVPTIAERQESMFELAALDNLSANLTSSDARESEKTVENI